VGIPHRGKKAVRFALDRNQNLAATSHVICGNNLKLEDPNLMMPKLNLELLKQLLAVAKPYWASERKRTAYGLLAAIIILMISCNGLRVLINYVHASFFNALTDRDPAGFYRSIWLFLLVTAVATPTAVFYEYFKGKLSLDWREWITKNLIDRYMANRNYYRINGDERVDNPDERIGQDAGTFAFNSVQFFVLFCESFVTLCAFSAVIWVISKTLVFALIGYSIIGTGLTVLVVRRLIGLNFNQLKYEADLRYGLIHVGTNTESIAFYKGEKLEVQQLKNRLHEAVFNFAGIIGWERNLGFASTIYQYIVIIVPALVIAPMFFAGHMKVGMVYQAEMACAQILAALSLIINQFRALSAYAAQIDRLHAFQFVFNKLEDDRTQSVMRIQTNITPYVKLENVTLFTPDHKRRLVQNLSFRLDDGDRLCVVGPSGTGKSSLLRAIAGLWEVGEGRVERPHLNEMLFLPQRPYMVLGNLRHQLLYPNADRHVTDEELQAALARVNLTELVSRVGGFDAEQRWADVLSLGEQQRLAFARLLLNKPRYLVLDESTSALDIENERKLYEMLRELEISFISVGHRSTLLGYHNKLLELAQDGGWNLRTIHLQLVSDTVPEHAPGTEEAVV
jgi:vitamin B12/bleomycin/antimicrobial peptide transport system ATP-binding/permease protein